MDDQEINIYGTKFKQIPISSDGNCLFRSISYYIYGSQIFHGRVRKEIVDHVLSHWDEFHMLTAAENGNNYTKDEYVTEMSLSGTYGSYCELIAANEIYSYTFIIYKDNLLFYIVGSLVNTRVATLNFLNCNYSGHFEVIQCVTDGVPASFQT